MPDQIQASDSVLIVGLSDFLGRSRDDSCWGRGFPPWTALMSQKRVRACQVGRAAKCRCRSCQNLPHDRCLLRLSSAYKCTECLLPSGLPSLRLWLKLWAPCPGWTAGVNWPWWKYDRKCSMWSDVPLFPQVSIWALSVKIDAISQSGGSWGDEQVWRLRWWRWRRWQPWRLLSQSSLGPLGSVKQ